MPALEWSDALSLERPQMDVDLLAAVDAADDGALQRAAKARNAPRRASWRCCV